MASSKTEQQLLETICDKLDRLIAFSAISGRDPDDHPDILLALGIRPETISAVTGLSKNAVNIRKSRLKKDAGKKKITPD